MDLNEYVCMYKQTTKRDSLLYLLSHLALAPLAAGYLLSLNIISGLQREM